MQKINNSQIVHKITLSWAVSECAIGGFLHALQSPFTGIIVGGLSVIFISLIAYYSEFKNVSRTLVQSLIFVLGIKLAVSPHSPLGAYLAVSMQAVFGMLFFRLIPSYSLAAIATGIFSLVTSAVQKVLILTLLFGMNFWEAIDKFSQGILSQFNWINLDFSLSKWLIGCYVVSYAIGGFFVGYLASKIPDIFKNRADEFDQFINQYNSKNEIENAGPSKKNKIQFWGVFVGLIVLSVSLQWIFISAQSAWYQLLRTVLVLVVWIFIVHPVFKWILNRSLQKRRQSLSAEIEQVQNLIPEYIKFSKFAWKNRNLSNKNSLVNFLSIYIYFAVYKV